MRLVAENKLIHLLRIQIKLCTQEVQIIIPKSWPPAYGDTYTGAHVVAMCVLVLKPRLGSRTAAEAYIMSIVCGLNDLHS